MCNQLFNFFKCILSKHQCGFRNGYNTQDCLVMMVEFRKETTDKINIIGLIISDLPKAFDFEVIIS